MLCGELPFEEESKSTLYEKILACKFSIPKYLSTSAVDLIKKVLVRDPKKRLNVEGILNHEWLSKYRPKDSVPLACDSYSKLDSDTAGLVAQKLNTDLQILKRMLSDNQHNDMTTL
jgi:serine/threonine protein kinase